jgi:hypothetical protein
MREARLLKAEKLAKELTTGIETLRSQLNKPDALEKTLEGLEKCIRDCSAEWESLKTRETGLETLEERMRRENNG